MKKYSHLILVLLLLISTKGNAQQIKNATTATVKVYGNCEMCKTTIEEISYKKKTAKAEWNPDTNIATLVFDTTKTNASEILKRIAYAGYDNEMYLAPDDAYAKLPGCCKYQRKGKKQVQEHTATTHQNHNNLSHNNSDTAAVAPAEINQLLAVYDAYFELKNALVNSDNKAAATKAASLVKAIKNINMGSMRPGQHDAWMKVATSIEENAESISNSTNLEKQRSAFARLSDYMIQLAPDAGLSTPVYQQHCPMYNNGKGADWLSKEKTIKNPYYGSQMLTCGKTVKTIK